MCSKKRTRSVVLIFSGLDPTGGAGIQADIEAIISLGSRPVSIVTAVTIQDTHKLNSFSNIDGATILLQARTLLEDIPIDCIKLGMLACAETIRVIASILDDYPNIPLVIDPIMEAGGGGKLSESKALQAMKTLLIPRATIITPNSIEARALATNEHNLDSCAQTILDSGCGAVLITGTHEPSHEVCNTLYTTNHQISHKNWPRLPHHYHGSGCTLSASIAALLAQQVSLKTAVTEAQQYTYNSLLHGYRLGGGQHLPDRFFWTSAD